LAKAAALIDRIARYRFPKRITETLEEFVVKVASPFGEMGERIAAALLGPEEPDLHRLLAGTPLVPEMVNAFLRTTVSPTMVQAGVKENVIPDSCEFVLDCRLLPSSSKEEVTGKIEELARELGIEIEMEILQYHPPSGSPVGTEFYRAIERALLAEFPEIEPVPFLLTGATDSRFLRELGATAYGFCPLSTEIEIAERMKLVHGDNERIDIGSLELGTRVFARIAAEVLQAQA
jgi:acetylornithine deacetylase/succinyl-diaminopimelate desuccinylase-like protein